jgi:hypothetical protein
MNRQDITPPETWRTTMKSPIMKMTAAAAVMVVAAVGIHRLESNTATHRNHVMPAGASVLPGTIESGQAPLEIRLPKPVFVGTKEPIRVRNIRKFTNEDRPPFLAPAGTKNVALDKPVTGSDEEPFVGEIEMITDDDKEAADGSFAELGPFLQHVTVDLEALHEIYAVVIWHYHKLPRVYFDVVVQISDDSDFTDNVRTIFNNDIDNSAGFGVGSDMHYVETYKGELIDAKGAKARYVRLYSNGNSTDDLNHYIEVEVYGNPVR